MQKLKLRKVKGKTSLQKRVTAAGLTAIFGLLARLALGSQLGIYRDFRRVSTINRQEQLTAPTLYAHVTHFMLNTRFYSQSWDLGCVSGTGSLCDWPPHKSPGCCTANELSCWQQFFYVVTIHC